MTNQENPNCEYYITKVDAGIKKNNKVKIKGQKKSSIE